MASGLWGEAVFGMNDGLVATVGLVAGLTMAGAPHALLLEAVLAAIWAAIISMALGAYLATTTEVAHQQALIRREEWELEDHPDEELEEMREIYTRYGFQPDEVQVLLTGFQRNPDLWLRLMLRDELGILPERFEHPWVNALVMALAVGIGSLPPLMPNLWMIHPRQALPVVLLLSAGFAFCLGVATSRLTGRPWWRVGATFFLVAAVATLVGSAFGPVLQQLFHVG